MVSVHNVVVHCVSTNKPVVFLRNLLLKTRKKSHFHDKLNSPFLRSFIMIENFKINNINDSYAWRFLESQFSENAECGTCTHYKNRKCELDACNYELKGISLP